MATLTLKIVPFSVPDSVTVQVGSDLINVEISELDEETVMSMLEDFSTSVMAQLPK